MANGRQMDGKITNGQWTDGEWITVYSMCTSLQQRYLSQDNLTNYTCVFDTFMPRHTRARESNKNQWFICNVVQRGRMNNVTKYTLIFVTLYCPGMHGHESNKNTCIICKVVLGQVTLSQLGANWLYWTCPFDFTGLQLLLRRVWMLPWQPL